MNKITRERASWHTDSFPFRASLLLVTAASIALYYGAYRTFNCPWSEDLALINQFCYSFVTELSFRVDILHFANALTEEHFRLILVLISPIYWVFKSSFTLAVLSILSASATLYTILRIFETVLGEDTDIAPLFLLLLVYPTTVNVFLTFGGRDCVFAMMFYALSLLFFLQDRFLPWMFACILASLCVEYTSLILCGYALVAILHKKGRQWTIFALAFGLGYFLTVNGFLMPLLRGDGKFAGIKFDEYAHLGRNPKEILGYFLFHPMETLKLIFEPQKIRFLIKLVLPLLFFPFLGIEYLLIPASQFLMVLLPQSFFYASTYWWYHTPIVPFVFTAGAVGMRRFRERTGKKVPRVVLYGISIILIFSSWNLPERLLTYGGYILQPRQPIWDQLERIPQEARVCAQDPFLPQVSTRKTTLMYPDLGQSDFVILGYKRNRAPLQDQTYERKVRELILDGAYGVVALFENGDMVLRKGHSTDGNRKALDLIARLSSEGSGNAFNRH